MHLVTRLRFYANHLTGLGGGEHNHQGAHTLLVSWDFYLASWTDELHPVLCVHEIKIDALRFARRVIRPNRKTIRKDAVTHVGESGPRLPENRELDAITGANTERPDRRYG